MTLTTLKKVPLILTPFHPLDSPALTSFYPSEQIPPHSYIILTRSAVQLSHHFNISEQNTPLLYHFTHLAAQLLHHFNHSQQNYLSFLHHFTPLGSSSFNSLFPIWKNYPLILTPFYPLRQINSYIILPPLNKLLRHSYTILRPLGSSPLISFYHPWTNYPLNLTQFYPPLQPNSYLILHPLEKYPLTLTAIYHTWQPKSYFTLPLWTNYLPPITPIYPLGSSTLSSFFFLWINYPHSYTILWPPGSSTLNSFYHP